MAVLPGLGERTVLQLQVAGFISASELADAVGAREKETGSQKLLRQHFGTRCYSKPQIPVHRVVLLTSLKSKPGSIILQVSWGPVVISQK